MKTALKLLEIANNVPLVYAAGEKKHTSKYATALVTGDGTNTISFAVPFEPDAVFVTYHGANVFAVSNSLLQAVFDFRSFATSSGMYRVYREGKFLQGAVSNANGRDYFRYADGVCTVEVLASYGTPFLSGTQYVCTAVKYTDKTDKELLAEEISLLPNDSRTVQYSRDRVYGAVTEEEWAEIIGGKNKITFSL